MESTLMPLTMFVSRPLRNDCELSKEIMSEYGSQQLKVASINQLDLALSSAVLDISTHPQSYFMILVQKATKLNDINAAREGVGQRNFILYLSQVSQFLTNAPISVIAKDIQAFSILCTSYVRQAIHVNHAEKVLYPIKTFLLRRYQEEQDLIPLHNQFLHLCIVTKHYAFADDILHLEITKVDKDANGFTALDFLKFAYYAGVIYQSQNDFFNACNSYLLAITAPAVSLSSFAVEAYKKYILVSLLDRGTVPQLPEYTSYIVTRHIHTYCSEYTKFADACQRFDWSEMDNLIALHGNTVFKKDTNFGLVKQCRKVMRRFSLQRVTETYMCLPLSNLTKVANWNPNLCEMEEVVLEAATEDCPLAQIDQSNALIFMKQDRISQSSSDMYAKERMKMEKLELEMRHLYSLSSQLQIADSEIVLNPKFINQLQRVKARLEQNSTSQKVTERSGTKDDSVAFHSQMEE